MENTGIKIGAFGVAFEQIVGMPLSWFIVLLIFVITEIILRQLPTKNKSSIINRVLGFIQSIIDSIIPDRTKDQQNDFRNN